MPGPDVDVELIALSARLWRELKLTRVRLMINSLGTPAARAVYRERLQQYLRAHESALDEDSRRRLHGNPLRILDSKNPAMRALIEGAPLLTRLPGCRSRRRISPRCAPALDALGVAYEVNPRLVRGLDYYSRTVFEWVTDALGAQDAVCSGGRYDGLIAQLGGEPTPAIGFALGVERVVELLLAGRQRQPPARPRRSTSWPAASGPSARRCAWPSSCAMRCRGAACCSIWAAAISRRSSAAPIAAGRGWR